MKEEAMGAEGNKRARVAGAEDSMDDLVMMKEEGLDEAKVVVTTGNLVTTALPESSCTFPPSISFATGAPTCVPSDWHTERGAKQCAMRHMDTVRLIGTAQLTVCVPATSGCNSDELRSKALGEALRELSAPIRHTNRASGPRGGPETWNKVGEPGHHGGLIPVGKLAEACLEGAMLVVGCRCKLDPGWKAPRFQSLKGITVLAT